MAGSEIRIGLIGCGRIMPAHLRGFKNLRDAGYQGSYSVEHHTGKNEYAEVAIQLDRVRTVFDRWRIERMD